MIKDLMEWSEGLNNIPEYALYLIVVVTVLRDYIIPKYKNLVNPPEPIEETEFDKEWKKKDKFWLRVLLIYGLGIFIVLWLI